MLIAPDVEPDTLSSLPLMCLIGEYREGAVFRDIPGDLAVVRLSDDPSEKLETWNENLSSLLIANPDINSVLADHRALPVPGLFADNLIAMHQSLDRSAVDNPLVFVTVGTFTSAGPELMKWLNYCKDNEVQHYLTPFMSNAERWLKKQGLRERPLPEDFAVLEQAMLFHSNYVGSVYLHYEKRVVIVQSSGFDFQMAVDRLRSAIVQATQMWGSSVVVLDCRKTSDLNAVLSRLASRLASPSGPDGAFGGYPMRALVLIHDNPAVVDRYRSQFMSVFEGRFLDVVDLRQGVLAGAAYALVPPDTP